ncbi:cyclin-dependent kinase [Ceratobasidium sp. AG-Ba]|nr:cyclin-dependent kinase [Ceratobasidium sp. AG-Ba]
MENYIVDKTKLLGEGTFGKVFKAREKIGGRAVALKQMKFDLQKDGIPGCVMKEISIMKELKHKHVVRILDIIHDFTERKERVLYLVLEHLEIDLRRYMALVRKNHDSAALPVPVIQRFTRHLMKGLAYCHSHRILHRDLKPGNLLIDVQQRLKIADFGQSVAFELYDRSQCFTTKVTTRWYRAPELLLGEVNYTKTIDIWSVGCIISEMARAGRPMFAAKDDPGQLCAIFSVLGAPTESLWPGVSMMPKWDPAFEVLQPKSMIDIIPHLPIEALDLVIVAMLYLLATISALRQVPSGYIGISRVLTQRNSPARIAAPVAE